MIDAAHLKGLMASKQNVSPTQTRGELAHHHNKFRPRVQNNQKQQTDPHFTRTHQSSCNIPNGWEQKTAVWQMLTNESCRFSFLKIQVSPIEVRWVRPEKIICPLMVDCPLRGKFLF